MRGRYEFKFPVRLADARAFLDEARQSLAPDPHGEEAAYHVKSLYFDTPDKLAYRRKLDGESRRRKFRLRTYGESEGPAFMEIKHRIDQTVFKERVRLTPEGALALANGELELSALDACVDDDRPDACMTVDRVRRLALGPAGLPRALITDYRREAWIGRVDARLRVTIDSPCRVLPPSGWSRPDGAEVPLLPADECVLEIKFDRAIPRWIRDLVICHRLRPSRFSKYATGVEALRAAAAARQRSEGPSAR